MGRHPQKNRATIQEHSISFRLTARQYEDLGDYARKWNLTLPQAAKDIVLQTLKEDRDA